MYEVNIKKLKISTIDKTLLDLSFKISSSTALIGQSGSGKSLSLKAILNLLPKTLKVQKDISANFVLDYNNIGFIPQNPFTSLSPMTKIKNQFFCLEEKKIELLKLVHLEKEVLNKFPNQLSGGQVQRVIIALALSKEIKLLLLDEPSTALDEENKENIISLLEELKNKLKILILFVSHDIDSVINLCEDIIIIKEGFIIEKGKTKEVLNQAKNPYTKELLNANFKNKEFRK